MYFVSNIEIDPSQITEIKSIKNGNALNRIVDKFNKKNISRKRETETFTVISILEQIRKGLEDLKVDNIIKLSVNGFNYYIDNDNEEHDLGPAINKLDKLIDPLESERFDSIELLIEHDDENFKYYINIDIQRKHKVGEYPIKITINGLMNRFIVENQDYDIMLYKLSKSLVSDEISNQIIDEIESKFKIFVRALENNLATFIRSDGVKSLILKKIIMPINSNDQDRYIEKDDDHYNLVFQNIPGIEPYLFYTLIWLDVCERNKLSLNDFVMLDYKGFNSLSFLGQSITSDSIDRIRSNKLTDEETSKMEVLDGEQINDYNWEYGVPVNPSTEKLKSFDYSKVNVVS
jgi:hypothetical protein